jgi:phosphoribosylanthranilate isomerase
LTNPDDALLAADLGATHIGLNFYPLSPRYISASRARQITHALRALTAPPLLVGVFVNEDVRTIRSTLDAHALDLAQLSGDETEETLIALGDCAYKAYRLNNPQIKYRKARLILLDSQVEGEYGGTGHRCDWDSAADVAQKYDVFLAGGLTPENVAQAIRHVRPWGVDVASGVERSPGIKDADKLQRFIVNACSPQYEV